MNQPDLSLASIDFFNDPSANSQMASLVAKIQDIFRDVYSNMNNLGAVTSTPATTEMNEGEFKIVHSATAGSRAIAYKYQGTVYTVPVGSQYADTRFKVVGFTRDTTVATGTQAVTNVGFTPAAVIFTAQQQATREASIIGFNVSGGAGVVFDAQASAGTYAGYLDAGASRPSIYDEETSGAAFYSGKIDSFDEDGFTIGWTRNSTPSGTLAILALCFR